MKIGIKSPQDLFALLIRRKWCVIVPFAALACLVALLTSDLPRVFISEALVLVQPRDVPEKFVMDLISGSTEQRLKSIQQTVLSRNNLVSVLKEFADRLPEYKDLNTDEAVEKLRSQITVTFDVEKSFTPRKGEEDVNSFRISYKHKNPEAAQKIASKLTTLFIEQDSRARETHVFGTTEFLSAELEKTAEKLQVSEAQLKALKEGHQFELPQLLDSNQKALDRLALQRTSNADAMDRAQSQRSNTEQQLALTSQYLEPTSQAARTPVGRPAPAAPLDPAIDEYRKAKADYERLSMLNTGIHPDVISAKAKLDKLAEKVPPEELSGAPKELVSEPQVVESKPTLNPTYTTLQGQLRQADTDIDIRRRERTDIENSISVYTRRIENTPRVEFQLSDVQRRTDELRKQYDDMNGKLNEARLSESLESKQKGGQFVIIDPANFPLQPAQPNKILVFLEGIAASFVLSIVIALIVDVRRQRVWTQSEIESFWGVPVIVDIPEIVSDADQIGVKRKRWVVATSSLSAAAAYTICLYAIHLKHNVIFQSLEPVLQVLVYR